MDGWLDGFKNIENTIRTKNRKGRDLQQDMCVLSIFQYFHAAFCVIFYFILYIFYKYRLII